MMQMIVDEAFFCVSRAGILNDGLNYPGLLRSGDSNQISSGSEGFTVLGQKPVNIPSGPIVLGLPEYANKIVETEDILIIANGAELIQRPRKLVEQIHAIRKSSGFRKLIYLQGVADPYLIPVLVYAGISLFDDSTIRMESIQGIHYTIFGRETVDANRLESNLEFVSGILEVVRKSIITGTLREIVEKYQISSKALEILRLLDNDAYGEMEGNFPRRTKYIKANSLESLRRPDLQRYRDYIGTQYRKPENRKIALVLPCSARKPYSSSKSHKRIIEALGRTRNVVHEVIVTSPVGVVPRDLEQVYPASAYDIPVIGEWFEDEKVMIKSLLEQYFANNHYDRVVAFVTEDLGFIKPAVPEDTEFLIWEKKGDESLRKLGHRMQELKESLPATNLRTNPKLETFIKIAEYQFGSWIRSYLEDCRIIKSYNSEMLVKEGKPALIFNDRIGKFTINKVSAQWFIENGKFLVEIDDFSPTANVYAVGVSKATEDIRQEDEVVLCHQGAIKGVGIAKMPGKAMVDLKKGTAVKVRN